jgi:N-methylhydantoinase A
MHYRLGVDTGGTFTDFILAAPGQGIRLYKTPSTPGNPSAAVHEGLRQMSAELGCSVEAFLEACDLIILGTTVGVNALIENKGAKTGLFCTQGHEDSLEIRLGHKEDGHRYDVDFPQAAMLVPRALRFPVAERVVSTGEVRLPLNENDIRRGIRLFKEEGVTSVAVSFVWSFLHPEHERRAAEIIRTEFPEAYLTLSVDVLPQIREYTRTSTTVINAYIGPIIKQYVERMEGFLRGLGYRHQVRYMQSNGGLTSGRFLRDKGIYALNSGPAAGPNAGLFFGEAFGSRDIITVDMGGTSFDIALTKDGKTNIAKDFDFIRYRIGIPMLQVETLGAGGGSIAFVNAMGLLQVGPESAGAQPGPAAYGRGGKRPTVTDALVILGYLNQEGLLGGRMTIDAEAARRAVGEGTAAPLKLSLEQAALGVFKIVNANMVNGIRRVSIEKGYDPRDFVLAVGGGAGPAHAGMLASELGIPTILIPKVSSAFCAFGEIISDMKHNYLSSYTSRLDRLDYTRLNGLFAEMEVRGRQELAEAGVSADQISLHRSLDMRYVDQIHECQVDIPATDLTPQNIGQIAEAFHRRHEELFTYSERDNMVEIINLESTVTGRVARPQLPTLARGTTDPSLARTGERPAFFEEAGGFRATPIYDGAKLLVGNIVPGPAIIEEVTTTIVVFPGWQVRLDDPGMYVMTSLLPQFPGAVTKTELEAYPR